MSKLFSDNVEIFLLNLLSAPEIPDLKYDFRNEFFLMFRVKYKYIIYEYTLYVVTYIISSKHELW